MAAIMVVEDHADTADTLALLLSKWGHRVQVCRTGTEAIASDFEPEVVLLDIGLPEVDGYHVAERLRKPGVKLVALTGYGQPQDIQHCQQAGFDCHLLKPVSAEHLQRVLAD